jgi:uncharacterized protein DUF1579
MNPHNDQDQVVLRRLVGCWSGQVRHRIAADQPFHESTGTAENRWVLGGRFVEMTLRALVNGQSWSAVFYIGYERGERRHVLVSLAPGDRQVTIRRGDWRHDRSRLVLTSRDRLFDADAPFQSTTICDLSADGLFQLALTEDAGAGAAFVRLQATFRPAMMPVLIGQPQAHPPRRFVIA